MSFTEQLSALWARFTTWIAGLSNAGTDGGTGSLSGAQRDTLVNLLDEGRPGQRWLAAEALGEAGLGRDGLAALRAALFGDDPILRWEAGNALALGGRPGRSALVDAMADGSPVVQAAAADGLGRLPADTAIAAALEGLLDGPHATVRQSAAEALARAGWPWTGRSSEPVAGPASRLLTLLADDPDPMVRRAAALALGRLGDPDARDALLARQEDPAEDWRVREAAALAESRLPAPVAVDPDEQLPFEFVEADDGETTAEASDA